MSMVATLEFSSNEEISKICNSSSGQLVFVDDNGTDNELASVLIADNKNLERCETERTISETTVPQNPLKLSLENCYIVKSKGVEKLVLLKNFSNFNKTESIIKQFFISWTRGRGT